MAGSQLQGPSHPRQRAGRHQRRLHLPGHNLGCYPRIFPDEANAARNRRCNDIYRLGLHNRLDGHCALGKSIIRMGPPYLGRSGTRNPRSCHFGILRQARFRPRVLLHETVPDLSLLSPHPGEYH